MKDGAVSDLGVGLIGCGNISSAYLRLAPLFAGLQVRGVADLNVEAADARGAEFGVPAMGVDTLLAHTEIDIVVNLTVPQAHAEVSAAALRAGKHVYSEKPFVLSLEEGAALRALAHETGLRLGSAPDTFLGGSHQQARALIDANKIGTVTAGTAHVMGRGMEHWHPNPDFFFKPGAGPVLDLGVYYITLLIHLLGPITRVAAMANSASPTRRILSSPRRGETITVDTPTNVHALLTFASGALVTLGASWDVKAHRHGVMELYGTEGSLFLADPNQFGGEIDIAGDDGDIHRIAPWDHPFSRANEPEGAVRHANYRAAGLADMAAAIREGRPHRCGLDLAIHCVEAMTAILSAAETGHTVPLTTGCDRPTPLTPQQATALLK